MWIAVSSISHHALFQAMLTLQMLRQWLSMLSFFSPNQSVPQQWTLCHASSLPETWLLPCPVPRYEILVLSCPLSPPVCRHSVCLWPVSFGGPVLTGAASFPCLEAHSEVQMSMAELCVWVLLDSAGLSNASVPVPSPYGISFARVSSWLLPPLPSRLLEHDPFSFHSVSVTWVS